MLSSEENPDEDLLNKYFVNYSLPRLFSHHSNYLAHRHSLNTFLKNFNSKTSSITLKQDGVE